MGNFWRYFKICNRKKLYLENLSLFLMFLFAFKTCVNVHLKNILKKDLLKQIFLMKNFACILNLVMKFFHT